MRSLKLVDSTERTYDSCLPSYADFLAGSSNLTVDLFNNTTYNIVNFERISVEYSNFEESLLESGSFFANQFPFKNDPTRNVSAPRGFVQNNNFNGSPIDLVVATDVDEVATTYGFMRTRDLVFRTRYNYHKVYLPSGPAVAYAYGHKIGSGSSGAFLVNEKAGTFRYGISNIEAEFASSCWRPDHYGHFRDMLEPRLHTATFDGEATVKIRFMSGSLLILDPTNTHAQNLSTFATSSMPYFDDGVARNRDDNPDETLLSV